jgi:hypothetical protein
MMARRIAAIGAVLCVLIGIPRASDAGILDFIWEMSGPQLIGVSEGCLYSPKDKKFVQCRLGDIPTFLRRHMDIKSKGPFIGFSAGLYGSTGVDSRTQQYDWFQVGMLELATGLSFRTYQGGGKDDASGNDGNDVQIHHGFGVAYERLFGKHMSAFNKFAITITPVDVTVKKIAFGVKLRIYPEGFTDDDFNSALPQVSDKPFETTISFTFGYVIRK